MVVDMSVYDVVVVDSDRGRTGDIVLNGLTDGMLSKCGVEEATPDLC